MLRIKRAETDASHSDDGALFPVVALLAAAAAIEYLLPGGGERSRVSSSVPVTKPWQDSAPQGAVPRKSPPVNAGSAELAAWAYELNWALKMRRLIWQGKRQGTSTARMMRMRRSGERGLATGLASITSPQHES